MNVDVSVCIPTIPDRRPLYDRAVRSVTQQSWLPKEICAAVDTEARGASATRNEAWQQATADWIAFLDDDDVLRPNHIKKLVLGAKLMKADVVYPWFNIVDVDGNDMTWRDPLRLVVDGKARSPFGLPFGPEHETELRSRNNFIPITVLVRRELVADVGGFPPINSLEWPENCCEDWALWRRLLDVGATFAHVPERTWLWTWHGRNTSGRSWKDATR